MTTPQEKTPLLLSPILVRLISIPMTKKQMQEELVPAIDAAMQLERAEQALAQIKALPQQWRQSVNPDIEDRTEYAKIRAEVYEGCADAIESILKENGQ